MSKEEFITLTGYTGDPDLLGESFQPGGLSGQIWNLLQEKDELQSLIDGCESVTQQKIQDNYEEELLVIQALIRDYETVHGRNPNLEPVALANEFQVLKDANPDANLLQFINRKIVKNPTGVDKALQKIEDLQGKANRFSNIVNGRPDQVARFRELRDPFSVLDPKTCGLVALENDGGLMTDDRYNIPFMYITEIKESKAANYNDQAPFGRFESHRGYTGANPMMITFEAGYVAFKSGKDSDEGFIQEIKDRWIAALYPIYGKVHRTGQRVYGTPNKYLLNMYDRFVNIPVIIKEVSFDNVGGMDPATWYTMGIKINVSLETSYRLAQVVSADEVVAKGIRALAHKNNI